MLISNAGSIELFYHHVGDVQEAVLERLICTLLTAPSIEALSATYARDLPESDPLDKRYRAPSFTAYLFPPLPTSRCTNLRELRLRWDGLSLHSLSLLLHMPKNLEVLQLHFSISCSPNHDGGMRMCLEEALKPVAHSLRELEIFLVQDYEKSPSSGWNNWRANVGLWWGEEGLREMKKLESLAIPANSWRNYEDYRRSYPGLLAGPESLVKLRLIGAQLYYPGQPREPQFNQDDEVSTGPLPAMNREVAVFWCMRLYHSRVLQDLLGFISSAPQLRHIEIGIDWEIDMDDIRARLPPIYLSRDMAPIVERGIRILVSPPGGQGGDKVELETRLKER